MCFAPQRRALFDISTSKNAPSVVLTSKCASRHNSVHFFDMSTSKSGLCTFWLGHVLRATTARTFSTSTWQLPKVLQEWCVCFVHFDFEMCFAPQRCALFSSLIWPDGSAPAALGAYFSTLRSYKSYSNHWKNTVNGDFSTFSRTCIFSLLTLSLLWSSLFFSSLLWLTSHLCFSICPYCRKFDF